MQKRKLKTISLILVLLCVTFIFSNSAMNAQTSSKESGFVFNLLYNFLSLFTKHPKLTHNMVRKLAHFTEFALLGLSLNLFFMLDKLPKVKALLTGFLIACADETIQLFSSGRASQFTDVLIDTSGVLAATLVFLLIQLCIANKVKK